MYSSEDLVRMFPLFDVKLANFIAKIAEVRTFDEGAIMMKPGQYFKSTMLITSGKVKLYREGEDGGEFFMYFLEKGDACALSMICATRNQTSEVMAIAI